MAEALQEATSPTIIITEEVEEEGDMVTKTLVVVTLAIMTGTTIEKGALIKWMVLV